MQPWTLSGVDGLTARGALSGLDGLTARETLPELVERTVDALTGGHPLVVAVAGLALLAGYRAVRRLVRLAWLVVAAVLLLSSWSVGPRGGTLGGPGQVGGDARQVVGDGATAPPAPPPAAWPAQVVRVLDGDTLEVAVGRRADAGSTARQRRRLRLLRVDAPELGRGGRPHECLAAAAAGRLSALTPVGSVVFAAHDVEPRDRYGRDLVHLWTAAGVWVNGALLRDGYAGMLSVPPNLALDGAARAAEAEARRATRGVWDPRHCG